MRDLCFGVLLLLLCACDINTPNVALGTLERDRIAHVAITNEVIMALPVSKGSRVSKGELLVQLDDTLQQAQVAKALADVGKAQANLQKLHKGPRKEEIAAAAAQVAAEKAPLLESQINYKRIKDLVDKNLSSQVLLDRAVATRDLNQARLESAEEQHLQLLNGNRLEDIQIAQADLDSANAIYALQQKKLADLTVTATRDGILDNLPWNLGERVTTGSPVAIVLAGKAPYARVYVPEPFRVKIKVNDPLMVYVDGLEQPIRGKVRWIANEPAFSPYYALNQQDRSRLMYLAEVQLPENAEDLPSGLPAQVELP